MSTCILQRFFILSQKNSVHLNEIYFYFTPFKLYSYWWKASWKLEEIISRSVIHSVLYVTDLERNIIIAFSRNIYAMNVTGF